jgi:NTP pyrophosphatase (non-canonical NTP hydrolase)
MTLTELVKRAHENAFEKGFWDSYPFSTDNTDWITARVMLVVTELAEAVEGLRHGDRANFAEELADTVIRIGDLCGGLKIDLEAEVLRKMAINSKRPRLHGKEF